MNTLKRMLPYIIIAVVLTYMFGGGAGGPHPTLDTAAQERVFTEMTPYSRSEVNRISFSELSDEIAQEDIAAAVFVDKPDGSREIISRHRDGRVTRAVVPRDEELLQQTIADLEVSDTPFAFEKQSPGILGQLFAILLPFIFLIGIFLLFIWFLNRARRGNSDDDQDDDSGGGGLGSLIGGSKSPLEKVVNPATTLDDVGGVNHIKPQLQEVVAKILNESQRGYLGGEVPKGFLFVGPPGTGKTLLARAIAGEVARGRQDSQPVTFFTVSASSFVEMFVGRGASRVRAMFKKLRENTPCIVFIDELDSLGKRGDSRGISGNDEREQTLNEMLVGLDGFAKNHGITFIGATNRVDKIDEALLRPGRLSRQVSIPIPDLTGREEILRIHSRKLRERALAARIRKTQEGRENADLVAEKLASGQLQVDESELPVIFAPDVDFNIVARETPGCSGADLEEILKRAAEFAEAEEQKFITMADIRNAFQSQILGDEMPRVMEFVDEYTTSVHEILGHAVIMGEARKTLGRHHADDIMSMTIIPRGMALGAVWTSPTKDRVSQSRKYLEGKLRIAMGGQIAEKLFLGPDEVTSGASSDIQQATRIASMMISQCAMTDAEGLTFRNYMEDTGFGLTKAQTELVDTEIDKLLDAEYLNAEAIILSYANATDYEGNNLLEMLARAMFVKKTLQGEEFMRLLAGEVLFSRAELDLGKNEIQFQALWHRQEAYRRERIAHIRQKHPEVARRYGLTSI